MARRYNIDFEPLLLEGDTVRLLGAGIPNEGLNVKCVAVGAMPERTKNFGALTGGTWDVDQEDTALEMGAMELGQFRMMIKTENIECRLKNPAPTQQWKGPKGNWHLPSWPFEAGDFLQKFYWVQSEFFVFEDTTPRFDFYSAVRTTLYCYVSFHGWRFKLEKIGVPGKITIWVSEWPSRSG